MHNVSISNDKNVFVIADIHGQYEKLMKTFKINDIRENDIVFFLGDFINKGPDNIKVLDFVLNRNNSYLLLGNHEETFIDHFLNNKSSSKLFLESAGGLWCLNQDRELMCKYAHKLSESCKYYYEISFNDISIGLCHASVPFNNWKEIRDGYNRYKKRIIWDEGHFRDFENSEKVEFIKNIDGVLFGHIPVDKRKVIGNSIYLDEGSFDESELIGCTSIFDAIKLLNIKKEVQPSNKGIMKRLLTKFFH
jgi:serine/threonine protein phosphatase 1